MHVNMQYFEWLHGTEKLNDFYWQIKENNQIKSGLG